MAKEFAHQFAVDAAKLWSALEVCVPRTSQSVSVSGVDAANKVIWIGTDFSPLSWGHNIGLSVQPAPTGSVLRMTSSSRFLPSVWDINKMENLFLELVGLVTTVSANPPSWREDPSGRHALRYFDGFAWTDHVRDGDVAGVDPYVGTPPGWHSDPHGRFELRYWDGSQWTSHVSTQGVTSVDAAG